MNTNLVNILTWAKPAKSTAALVSVNIILWFLIRQRPLCVIPLSLLVYYLRYIWKHRIRPEVLVDPPDHEDWITLSSYDLEHVTCSLGKSLWKSWVNLRHENHVLWTVGTCTVWMVLAKIGHEIDFLTFLFVVSNAAFVIFPLLEFVPKSDSSTIIQTEDLIPEVPTETPPITPPHQMSTRSRMAASFSSPEDFAPFAVPVSKHQPSTSQSLYEGIISRSMAAAAVGAIVSSSLSSTVFSSGIVPSSLLNPSAHKDTSQLPLSRDSSPGPESLTPAINAMPDHEIVDSDLEDEFLFDAKHFDKSSSSSISNSFEIIDDL